LAGSKSVVIKPALTSTLMWMVAVDGKQFVLYYYISFFKKVNIYSRFVFVTSAVGESGKLIPTQGSPFGLCPYHARPELANVKAANIPRQDGKPAPLKLLSIDETIANSYHYYNRSNPDPPRTPIFDDEKRFKNQQFWYEL